VVEAYNNDGSLDKKATQKMNEKMTSPLEMTTVVALRNEAGTLFYQEIDLSNKQIEQVMTNAIGADNDLNTSIEAEKQEKKVILDNYKNTSEEEVRFREAINIFDRNVYTDPSFENEAQNYWGSNSGGQLNRNKMIKSFYTAFDYVANGQEQRSFKEQEMDIKKNMDRKVFSQFMEIGKIKDELSVYGKQGVSESDLIMNWLQNVNSPD